MKSVSVRKLFFFKWSNRFEIENSIPAEDAICDVDEFLWSSLLMIITINKPNNKNVVFLKWFIIAALIGMTIKFVCLILIDTTLEENRDWIFILGDISFLVAGHRIIVLTAACFMTLIAVYIVYSFSFTEKMPWLKLFRFLEGKYALTPIQMGITDVQFVIEIIARHKTLVYLVKSSFPKYECVIVLFVIREIYFQSPNIQEILYIILWFLYYSITFDLIARAFLVTLILFYITVYYINIRAHLFNKKLDRILDDSLFVKRFLIKSEIKSMIKEHAKICNNIEECNQFFSKFYSIGLVVCLPCSLIAMNMLLFVKNMNQLAILLFSVSILFGWAIIFIYGFILAMSYQQVRKNYKKLCKIEWKFRNINIGDKIKVSVFI